MKIKEILELTKKNTMAEIAKEHLMIGEKPARQALKYAGCYSIVGQPGWHFDECENKENLEKSIYDVREEVDVAEKSFISTLGESQQSDFIPRKRHSFDLDLRIVKKLKLHCIKEDKNLYEVVEKAIGEYLAKVEKE